MNVTFNKVQNDWLEASYKDDDGKELAFVSYHPTQMDLITADMLKHGVELTPEDESMLEKWVAAYVPPAPEPAPVPQVLTMRQARLVLHQVGLLDDVEAAVKAADRSVQIEFEFAQEVSRTWPTLIAMATALGLTESQLDNLFIQGALL